MPKKVNICPLLSVGPEPSFAPCQEDRCAWFHIEVDPEDGTADGTCALESIANALQRMKKTPASAANADRGKVEKVWKTPIPPPTIPEKRRKIKHEISHQPR